jgi:hypothetical protein
LKTHVLKGSKQEIAASLARLNGEVREAIVFVEDTAPMPGASAAGATQDIFAEMRPFMVDVPDVDDSRETIYSRTDGE